MTTPLSIASTTWGGKYFVSFIKTMQIYKDYLDLNLASSPAKDKKMSVFNQNDVRRVCLPHPTQVMYCRGTEKYSGDISSIQNMVFKAEEPI